MWGLVGVVLGFFLSQVAGVIGRRRENAAHWSILKVEVDFIGGTLAPQYLNDGVFAPAYRCPTVGYASAFPALLRAGQIKSDEADALLHFYSEVETLNRSIDATASAVASTQPKEKIKALHERGRLKAERLQGPDGELFKNVATLLRKHV